MNYRRLPLDDLVNARDLGGYPTADGGSTRFNVFIRSELPRLLTEKDLELFRGVGLEAVLDLRGQAETERAACAFANVEGVDYIRQPMYEECVASGGGSKPHKKREVNFVWGVQYVRMCREHMDWVYRVLLTLSGVKRAALFHCTTGKDRTGIISALLLSLCGVSDRDVEVDYAVSQMYMREKFQSFTGFDGKSGEVDLSDPFFSTAPENMRFLLNFWREEYGGAYGYLRACGLEDDVLRVLREKLVCPSAGI